MNSRPLAATALIATMLTPPALQAAPANPFFAPSPLPFNYPQFDRIRDSDFGPAFDAGMQAQLEEVRAIADNPAPPTFDNTLVALERSGQILRRARTVFSALVAADTNDARNQLRTEYAPRFAAHSDAILLDAKLFARIQTLHAARDTLGLDAEGQRLIERYHSDFVRAGARLSAADKEKLKALNAEAAALGSQFTQNVLDEVNASAVVVEDRAQLDGLTEAQVAAAAEEAQARGLPGKYVLTLLNTTGQPVNVQLTSRALRQRVHEASVARGSRGGEFDNRGIVARTMQLRATRAALLGFPDYASYGLEDQTARTPAAVNAMLRRLAPAAVANARREAADLQARIHQEGGDFTLAPWDWDFYSEKVRVERFAFDEAQLKPYLELTNVLEKGVFHAANRLYGLTFKRRTDLPVYHPDVWVYEVADADGRPLALFIADMYARRSKRGGAWMNAHVPQSRLLGQQPVVANHLNITRPPAGEPTLLTWDEVITAFHEFGHALHGMFSQVEYPYFSGTSVPRDFVEFPSQVNEMWAAWPEVLQNYAVHYRTGEPIPQALLDKVIAAQKFNQGFATTEYLAAALLDQRWHQLAAGEVPDADAVLDFEAAALRAEGVDFAPVPPRYRTTYFSHIMGGYQAGYYAYIWAEVLDADTQQWFRENGGLTRANGQRFRQMLLSRGGSVDAMTLYRQFTGREPRIEPLLEKRGLAPAAAATAADAVVEEHFGITIADPFRWLENDVRTDPRVRDWVTAQNAVTDAWLADLPGRQAIRERLAALWDYERFGLPVKAGGHYFHLHNSGLQNQPVLKVRAGLAGPARELIDPNTWAEDGATALAEWAPSKDGRHLAYAIQDGGSDWRTLRVLDVATATPLADEIRWAKFTGIAWAADGSGIFYSRFAEPAPGQQFQALNEHQQVWFHRIGTPQSEDRLIHATPDRPLLGHGAEVTDDGVWLVITTWQGTDDRYELTLLDLRRPDARPVSLVSGLEHNWSLAGSVGDTLYFVTNKAAPLQRVVAFDAARPALPPREIVPQAGSTINGASLVGEHLLVSYLVDAKTEVHRFTLDGTPRGLVPLPGIGTATGFDGETGDAETFFSFASYHLPTAIYRYDSSSGEVAPFATPQVAFDPDDYQVEQHFYHSADGTRVPLFLLHRKGLELENVPVQLYAYGGFNVSMTPGFNPAVLAWAQLGGVYAVAVIRGGGEYGKAWHDAGRLANKQNVFDDFIAAAGYLVDEGITTPGQLVIRGGSNGGLLVGAVVNQRPELFAAALPQVGVMDMLRFNRFTAGRYWVDDYGDPGKEADFRVLHAYSPYHNIREGRSYPAILATTADTDDRVVPGHTFKYVAALQAADLGDRPRLARIETRAGHGAGKPTDKQIDEYADMWAFAARWTGLEIPQGQDAAAGQGDRSRR